MSATAVAWVSFPIHMVLCGGALFVTLMVMVVVENVFDGLVTFVGSAFGAAVFTLPALVVGLPLRCVPVLQRLWFRSGIATLVLVAIGVALIVLSFHVGAAGSQSVANEPGYPPYEVLYPDETVALVALFVLALGLAHLWPPRPLLPRAFRHLLRTPVRSR